MKTLLITIILLLQFAQSQIIPQIEPTNPVGLLSLGNNLFNTEKFNIQQGFTVGTSFSGNQSTSYGMFTNSFQYELKPNIKMTGGVHLLQKSGNTLNPYQNDNFDVLYDLNLKYQPWENTWIQLSISNMGLKYNRNNLFTP